MDKPPRTFWQIWNMSFGFLGIQFGWGLQMANMSAIYEYLGARADQIPILWLAAPLTGLIVQPIIGHASCQPEQSPYSAFNKTKPFECLMRTSGLSTSPRFTYSAAMENRSLPISYARAFC